MALSALANEYSPSVARGTPIVVRISGVRNNLDAVRVVKAPLSAVSLYEQGMLRPDESCSGGKGYGTQESRILQWKRLI